LCDNNLSVFEWNFTVCNSPSIPAGRFGASLDAKSELEVNLVNS
jgi:hypothetical protein